MIIAPVAGIAVQAEAVGVPLTRDAYEAGVITHEACLKAIERDATSRRILAKGHVLRPGEKFGGRVNLNVLRATGVPVTTVHKGGAGDGYRNDRGWWGNTVVSYVPWLRLEDAFFNVHQKLREDIASGSAAKGPMASVDGTLVEQGMCDVSGVEVRFNPKLHHLFCDQEGRAVRWAENVTIVAHRVFARGLIVYHDETTAPARSGEAPSLSRLARADEFRGAPAAAPAHEPDLFAL